MYWTYKYVQRTILTGRQTERIDWIDIAKGITIILVIVGHTVEFGGLTRNFIFLFICHYFSCCLDTRLVWRRI